MKLLQSLDLQQNMNKCQYLTIEKLENKIISLEAEKNDDTRNESKYTIEKAKLQRQIAALENKVRFETNINEENRREIEKMNVEISQHHENYSAREHILQRKVEDTIEQLRKERGVIGDLRG